MQLWLSKFGELMAVAGPRNGGITVVDMPPLPALVKMRYLWLDEGMTEVRKASGRAANIRGFEYATRHTQRGTLALCCGIYLVWILIVTGKVLELGHQQVSHRIRWRCRVHNRRSSCYCVQY